MTRWTPDLAAALLGAYFAEAERESVATLHLDREARLLAISFGEGGDAGGVDLPVRDILADALRMGAAGIVIAHNHPSGDPAPSEEDLRATRRLAEAAAVVGVKLVDHLIFAGGRHQSLRDLRLL
jgi:DNA repair protein RadC